MGDKRGIHRGGFFRWRGEGCPDVRTQRDYIVNTMISPHSLPICLSSLYVEGKVYLFWKARTGGKSQVIQQEKSLVFFPLFLFLRGPWKGMP
jgi:hypothetical protein